eukprot:1920464-Alexandrium_andersonii.AAC.1
MSNLPRSSAPAGARDAPEVARGHCSLTKVTSDATLTVLVKKDRDSRAILARPVLRKGLLRDDAVDQAVASVRRFGHHHRVLLETDKEPALLDLRRAVAERLG